MIWAFCVTAYLLLGLRVLGYGAINSSTLPGYFFVTYPSSWNRCLKDFPSARHTIGLPSTAWIVVPVRIGSGRGVSSRSGSGKIAGSGTGSATGVATRLTCFLEGGTTCTGGVAVGLTRSTCGIGTFGATFGARGSCDIACFVISAASWSTSVADDFWRLLTKAMLAGTTWLASSCGKVPAGLF